MIRVKDGNVYAVGNPVDILTDISVAAQCIKEGFESKGISAKDAEKMIVSAVQSGFMSNTELDKEIDRLRAEMVSNTARRRGL